MCTNLIIFITFCQSKVEEAERKYKQTEEDLERITQQVQELQPKCVELKTEAQKRNNALKSCEVGHVFIFYLIFDK